MFQGDIDPEIAALLGADTAPKSSSGPSPLPDYGKLFGDEEIAAVETLEVDLGSTSFPKIEKPFESDPHKAFDDPDYYKKSLSNEGDQAQRVHTLLQKYVNSKDPKDRGVFRQQLITAYWDFLAGVARKAPGKLIESKRFLLRFGMLHPTFMSPEDRNLFARIIVENEMSQPIYYLDEWLKSIGTGSIKNSMTDEVRVAKSNEQVRIQQLLDKAAGKRDGARNLLKGKSDERASYEAALVDKAKYLSEHTPVPGFSDVDSGYTDVQRRVFNEIQEIMKNMQRADKELSQFLDDFEQANKDVETLEGKASESGGGVAVNVQAIDTEFETIKQMAKLTIGRQGNHFPLLTREYFRCGQNDLGTRENVIAQMGWIESIDPEAFCRSYKNKMNRIVPYVVIIPAYGDIGICWEPFDRFNRATSRGRIAVPMYPKNLPAAILSAVADLRWQVAKEKASYYWMEEGLTGNYYQWFVSKKLKGDVKEYFIQDYIIWLTKESDAVQKLEKEVRGIFWRFIPFSQEVKEKLKSRSYVYQELYQRDVNRSMSDGY
ncbi:MAG: hypothetical protein A2Z99_10835 [Treponema sp. GWB1_62_6]|nr:MAG: hypothetical protein A2Z99_10835 [Treponema sp. GWB1_62_6]OHE68582.1 MAG: hypothetical protein A2413_12625 [Treponema sp. RIFOXYC1_FULL_61_9]HCM26517.1 hypothetical protein [Treponema sp.]